MPESSNSFVVKLLRKSERFTKTDMVYLAHGGSLSLLNQVVSTVASFAFAIAVSHLLPKETFGIYKYILSLVAMISLLSLNSIGNAVFQSAAQGLDGALKKAFWINIRWSIGIFITVLITALYYFALGNATIASGLLIGGLLSPLIASTALFASFLRGKKDFYHLTLYNIVDTIIPISILITVMTATKNPILLIATYSITNALAGLFFYRRTLILYRNSLDRQDPSLLSYSKHLSVMGIASGMANIADQILLFHFVGAAQLAIYNFAIAIPDQIKGPAKNIYAMLQARFVGRTDLEIERGMNNKMLWFGAIGVFITFSYIALAPFLFHTFFPAYSEAIWYSQIYALWILSITFEPTGTYLAAKKLTNELYISYLSYTIIQLITLYIGVLFWGLTGVIVARVVARLLVNILNYALYLRVIKMLTYI